MGAIFLKITYSAPYIRQAISKRTSWLPHHWQLLQTGPETSNFDENKKVRHVVCIEFREEFISGFDNRQFLVLAIFVIW